MFPAARERTTVSRSARSTPMIPADLSTRGRPAGSRRGSVCIVAVALFLAASPVEARRICPGDCSGDGAVTVEEILLGVNLALTGGITGCAAGDSNGDQQIAVPEVVEHINNALHGCPLVTVADAAFWQTLWAEADREEESLELYEQAIAADPNDGRSHFLKGMMHLYRYGQSISSFDEFNDFAAAEVVQANADLDRAVELTPENRGYPGFRGAATFQHGVTIDDEELAALGLAQLRESMEIWPLFNRFSFLGTVAAVVPAGSELFQESYDHFIDLLSPASLAQCTGEICGNAGRAPRNLEGSGILFGDIYAKAGNLQQARGWYQLALGSGSATSWRFTGIAQQRLATVADRVALYKDEDPDNDPPLVGLANESCAICHAR
jgi:hypothetical protein